MYMTVTPLITAILFTSWCTEKVGKSAHRQLIGTWKVTNIGIESDVSTREEVLFYLDGVRPVWTFSSYLKGHLEVVQESAFVKEKPIILRTVKILFEYRLDTSTEPARINFRLTDPEKEGQITELEGIFQLAGDKLKLCIGCRKRPSAFPKESWNKDCTLYILERSRVAKNSANALGLARSSKAVPSKAVPSE